MDARSNNQLSFVSITKFQLADQFLNSSSPTDDSTQLTSIKDIQEVRQECNSDFCIAELEWALGRVHGLSAGSDDVGYPPLKNHPCVLSSSWRES